VDPRIPKYVPIGNAAVRLFTRLGVKTVPSTSSPWPGGSSSTRARSTPVTPWQVDGKRYVIAAIGTSDWARNARGAGEGSLTSGRTTTRVRLTELTDPALKERVVTAFGTESRAGGSFLVQENEHRRAIRRLGPRVLPPPAEEPDRARGTQATRRTQPIRRIAGQRVKRVSGQPRRDRRRCAQDQRHAWLPAGHVSPPAAWRAW
jgi:hypothetical protein